MKKIPVFYSPLMDAPPKKVSPSAAKPALAVASWEKLGVPLDIHEPLPATVSQFALAHERKYVLDVLCGKRNNGFGDSDPLVAKALPYTTGSMLTAAKYALANGARVAVAPVSGFHHAGYDGGGGFCTFNGLVVTARVLVADKRARCVGILDCDQHYGNGTDEIISQLGLVEEIVHFTAGRFFHDAGQVPKFWKWLDVAIGVMAMHGCDIILYQAGADPHINDPLGGWMTTDELRERDARVFAAIAHHSIPVVWDLAGGYQVDRDGGIGKVLAIHDNTMRECARVYLEKAAA